MNVDTGPKPDRQAEITRKTTESDIRLRLSLDGSGAAEVNTGIGFFDHMLTHLARHGLFDIEIAAKGDLYVDGHHTVEDVGICLGKAFAEALGTPVGITRYGQALVPMDEALAEAAVDISGRPYLVFKADLPLCRVGDFDSELVEEFLRAFSVNSRFTVHVILRYGKNVHHCIEAMFKALARALALATARDPRVAGIPSTKGVLET